MGFNPTITSTSNARYNTRMPIEKSGLVVISDRGGHWHNAQMLIQQLGVKPGTVITTKGPEVTGLRKSFDQVVLLPTLFTFVGKKRFLNPVKSFLNLILAGIWVVRLRTQNVISLGATNVVFFCYFAKLFGARLYHVECMNQVVSASITGQFLYPICDRLYVQWPELLKVYGPKAHYEGWVI